MLKVQEQNNNESIPQYVRGIVATVIEELKGEENGELLVNHNIGSQHTWLMFSLGNNEHHYVAKLSHVVYPEETLVTVFEDRRDPKVIPMEAGKHPIVLPTTKTRHYQPKKYFGMSERGGLNSAVYVTDVTRRDESFMPADIIGFLRHGVMPN